MTKRSIISRREFEEVERRRIEAEKEAELRRKEEAERKRKVQELREYRLRNRLCLTCGKNSDFGISLAGRNIASGIGSEIGVSLEHGIVRSVLPIDPPTFIVFDEQIEKLKAAGIPFTVITPK